MSEGLLLKSIPAIDPDALNIHTFERVIVVPGLVNVCVGEIRRGGRRLRQK
jgi:hypothetical protein